MKTYHVCSKHPKYFGIAKFYVPVLIKSKGGFKVRYETLLKSGFFRIVEGTCTTCELIEASKFEQLALKIQGGEG